MLCNGRCRMMNILHCEGFTLFTFKLFCAGFSDAFFCVRQPGYSSKKVHQTGSSVGCHVRHTQPRNRWLTQIYLMHIYLRRVWANTGRINDKCRLLFYYFVLIHVMYIKIKWRGQKKYQNYKTNKKCKLCSSIRYLRCWWLAVRGVSL